MDATVPTYLAEPCNSNNNTFLKKGYYQYPFANIEHRSNQHEKLSESFYNENGDLLKKNEYQYEDYSSSPIKIYGLAWDNNYGIKQFSKYYYEVYKRILLHKKETIYDSNLSGNSMVLETDFDNSAFNRNVRSVTITNSDNSKTRTTYFYSGDFSAYSLSEVANHPEALGIYWLNKQNLKHKILEQSTYVALPGSSQFKTVSSQVNLYRKNPSTIYDFVAQSEQRIIRNTNGLTDFVPVHVEGSGIDKSFVVDSRYEPYMLFENYNTYNMPQVVTEKQLSTTMINDYILRVPLLRLTGAKISNIVFSNFDRLDGSSSSGFTIENVSNLNYIKDAYTHSGYKLGANKGLNKSFVRDVNDKFYKFAFLCKSAVPAQVDIQVNGNTVATVPIVASTNYKFYEREIDLVSLTSGTIRMVTSAEIIIDNVIFYPSDSQFEAFNYDYSVGKTFEMTSSGFIRLYDYDVKGRLLAVKDMDGNILEAKLYNESSSVTSNSLYNNESLKTEISVENPTDYFVGRTIQFNAKLGCVPGVKFVWDFGDGNVLQTYNAAVNHVYNASGNYVVTLSIEHPELTTFTTTRNISIAALTPISGYLLQNGIARMNTCTMQRFYVNGIGGLPGNMDSPYGTKFYAFASGCPLSNYIYNWEISFDGYFFDTYTSTTVNNIEIPENNFWGDYYIRCRITSPSCGTEVITNDFFLEFNCSVY